MRRKTTGRCAVLIAGPTASGKSALAIAVAQAIGGTVVNADSMQVYAELRILSARPSPEDEARVPHRLYGHVPAAEAYTVARWLADMAVVLDDLAAAGRVPVIVGGTGLYFDALTRGLSEVPPIPDAVRDRWRAAAEVRSAPDLHAELASRDAAMAGRLRPTDTQRIVRALEVIEATGRSLADWQSERHAPLLTESDAVAMVLAPDRAILRRRIADRFAAMLSAGGLEEARALAGLDPSLPARKAIGVPEMIAAATGERPVEAAVADAVLATGRYAKRQETWFRNRMAGWRRVDPLDPRTVRDAMLDIERSFAPAR